MSENKYDALLEGIKNLRQHRQNGEFEIYCKRARQFVDVFIDEDLEKIGRDRIAIFIDKIDKKTIDEIVIKIADDISYHLFTYAQYTVVHEIVDFTTKVVNMITDYQNKERFYKRFNTASQIILYLGIAAFLIANYLNLAREISNIIAVLIAATATLSNLFKFEEKVFHYHRAAENLQQELNLFQMRRKDYQKLESGAAFDVFTDRIDKLLHELSERSLSIERTAQSSRIEEFIRTPKVF